MAISKQLLEEVNYYSKLAKERMLTDDEKEKQQKARKQYLNEFKAGMREVLDNTIVVKQITIAKSHIEVKHVLEKIDGITKIENIGLNLTQVTYDIKKHDATKIVKMFEKPI